MSGLLFHGTNKKMNKIFTDFQGKDVEIYIDDIVIDACKV